MKINERGFALLTAAAMVAVLMGVIAGLMYFGTRWRARSASVVRTISRQACAESGLQLAKAFYGQNYQNWNTYLANPGVYNPVPITRGGPRPTADPVGNLAAITAVNPNVVADLDGDGLPDVYIYIRDNEDEYINNQPNNPARDNDQMVIVGSMCISRTMVPRREDGTLGPTGQPEPVVIESLLQFVDRTQLSAAQLNLGTFGGGNAN